ncbi:hypothetical protein AB205_0022820 [Aquarana catesbeiana]|uniref:Uncharacterized protein n=1 Tax=Aquarana catesbeiana TaxID=8400 RepID=A0A2G9QB51_AQUCT|nr:hypothetical protein AB205_0022820 [Aquarana catesbeiana]
MHTVCQHVLSAIRGYQFMRFVGATPSSQLKELRGREGLHPRNTSIDPP